MATFGAGCFWSVEEIFTALDGVSDTQVGYMGGTIEDPDDASVARGDTGHAEVVHLEYRTAYRELLAVFWECHDPTTPDQQGPDIGPEWPGVARSTARSSSFTLSRRGSMLAPI